MKLLLKPDVLKWARERAGLSPQALALKLKIRADRVADWERTGRLNFKEAEKLADRTHVPFGSLYLDSPLEETLPISDFRTLRDTEIIQPSPDLIDTIDIAILRQDWFRDYQIASGDEEVPFVGSLSETDSIPSAVRKIKHFINWDTAVRASISRWEDA
jgi:transcriptional regulator with XRE-family HTH domain